MTHCIRSPQVCPSARELNIFPVHDEQPHMPLEVVGSVVGNSGEVVGDGDGWCKMEERERVSQTKYEVDDEVES